MEVGTSSVLMLPYTASSVGVARRQLTGELAKAGVFQAIACDASLVLSELVSNALRHGSPLSGNLVRVAWELSDDCVEITVSDGGGATVPVINRPAANALGGRGLGIVERLSLRWGVFARQDGHETAVWAALPLLSAEAEDLRDGGPESVTGSLGDSDPDQDLVIASSHDA
jgi:anti-sigma regulatory factor (Ser/Thr protein kinase)